jgi:hypothetical protein
MPAYASIMSIQSALPAHSEACFKRYFSSLISRIPLCDWYIQQSLVLRHQPESHGQERLARSTW